MRSGTATHQWILLIAPARSTLTWYKLYRTNGDHTWRSSSDRPYIRRESRFLPCDATQARPMPLCGVCPSVRLSVRPIVTFTDSVYTNKRIFNIFHHSSFSIPNVMATFRREPLTEASNAGEVGRNRDSEPISGFIACCQRCDWLSTRRRRTVASCDTYHW